MSQIYNENTKRPKPKKSAWDVKSFCILCPGESAAVVTYLSMRIQPKNYHIFPKKIAATLHEVQRRVQLEHSSHIVKVGVKATC